jgi:hypothetical protein
MTHETRLDDSTFLLYAAKHYTAPGSTSLSEFYEDLDHIKHTDRLIRRYARSGVLNERLLMNHLVTLYNVFDPQACTRMLVFRLWPYLDIVKPLLDYLRYWPETVKNIGTFGETVTSADIVADSRVIEILKGL